MKSPRLTVSINCSVTLIISCLLFLKPSSSSMLLLLVLDESDDSLTLSLSSDPSVFTFAMTLLPVRNVYWIQKFYENRVWEQRHTEKDLNNFEWCLLEKFRVANIVVRIAPLSFRRALNFFKQSTVSCLWMAEATRSRCYLKNI